MDNKNEQTVSFQYVLDITAATAERTVKRLWITILLLILLLVGTNAAWIYYESQFTVEETSIEAQTDDGGTAIANQNGEVTINGASENHDQTPRP